MAVVASLFSHTGPIVASVEMSVPVVRFVVQESAWFPVSKDKPIVAVAASMYRASKATVVLATMPVPRVGFAVEDDANSPVKKA